MVDSPEPSRPSAMGRRRGVLLAVAGLAMTVTAVALALFQPWKLWVDDTVDEAAPAGAVAITAAAPGAPTTVPSTTVPAGGADTTAPPASAPAVVTAAPTVTMAPSAPTTTPPTTIAPPPPLGGSFVGIDHGTSGSVVLLQDPAGIQFVRLEELDTSNGPDLFVYLSTNPPDGPEGQFDDDVVNLGRLQGNVGSSNYAIPAGTDIARYASIVIWCDRFNSAFGAAPLI
jgi:hypothetical protein